MRIVFRFCVVYFTPLLARHADHRRRDADAVVLVPRARQRLADARASPTGSPSTSSASARRSSSPATAATPRFTGFRTPGCWSLAVLITAAWLMLQPGRDRERTWHAWFRVFVRFAMAAQMFYYGMAKIIPTQFPPPSLVTLVESVGNLSLSDLLWTLDRRLDAVSDLHRRARRWRPASCCSFHRPRCSAR